MMGFFFLLLLLVRFGTSCRNMVLRTSLSVLGPPNSFGLYLAPEMGVAQPSGSSQVMTKGSLVPPLKPISLRSIGVPLLFGLVVGCLLLILNLGLGDIRLLDCLEANNALATGPKFHEIYMLTSNFTNFFNRYYKIFS